jgi:hypothetical protein
MFGGYGAAIGNLLAEAAIMLAGFHMIYQSARIAPSFRLFPKIAVAGAVMALVMYVLRSQHVLITLCIGVCVYIGLVFALKILRLSVIREVLSKNINATKLE